MTKNKILIIGGLHGDENLGIDIVNLLRNNPIEGIDGIFGNPMATAVNSRYIDKDLNRVFPGDVNGCLEEIRAAQIMQIAKDYDYIIDIHNTTSPDNDCSFVGGNYNTETLQLSLALGLTKVIDATYDCINKYLPNCLSTEISFDSKLNDAQNWYDKILELANMELDSTDLKDLELFQFLDRVSEKQSKEYGLKLQNFVELKDREKIKLRVDKDLKVVPIFVNPDIFAGNYCALAKKIN
jgi:hypothetical protein